MAKLKNKKTGFVTNDIGEWDQSVYNPEHWEISGESAPAPVAPTVPAGTSPSSDTSTWGIAQPAQPPADIPQATLISDNKKVVVDVGSDTANQLLEGGWEVGSGEGLVGASIMSLEEALGYSPTVPDDAINSGMSSGADGVTLPSEGEMGAVNTSAGTVASGQETIKTIDDYIKEMTPPPTETSEEAETLTSEMSELLGSLSGKAEMLEAEEEKAGVDTISQNLNSINNELSIKIAAYEKLYADIQSKPITMSSIIGAQAQARAVAQADIGFLQARASALQNNLTFAQQQAQQAVDDKYAPILEELSIKQDQLKLLQPMLDKEENIYANALNAIYADQAAALKEKKETEKDIQDIVLRVLNNGGDTALADQVANTTNVVEAAQIAGILGGEDDEDKGWSYVSSPIIRKGLEDTGQYEFTISGGRTYSRPLGFGEDLKTQVITASGRSLLINKQTGETIKDLGGAYKDGSGTASSKGFKFSSEDIGRLLNVGFTQSDLPQIEEDVNEFGVDKVVKGLPENQAKAIRDIYSGVTPTQANADDSETVTESKRKVIGGVNALMLDNASVDEINEYISLKGYVKDDFIDLLKGYTPEEQPSNWGKIKSFFGF